MITLATLYLIATAFVIYKYLTCKDHYDLRKTELEKSVVFMSLPILVVILLSIIWYLP